MGGADSIGYQYAERQPWGRGWGFWGQLSPKVFFPQETLIFFGNIPIPDNEMK